VTVPGDAATRSPECLISSAATLSTRLVGVVESAIVTWTIGVIPSDIVSGVCGYTREIKGNGYRCSWTKGLERRGVWEAETGIVRPPFPRILSVTKDSLF